MHLGATDYKKLIGLPFNFDHGRMRKKFIYFTMKNRKANDVAIADHRNLLYILILRLLEFADIAACLCRGDC